jgi:RNA polymerase sigma-70 factor (ECF subfamily)
VLDREASLDLTQEAFVKAYVRLKDCRKPESFRGWLFSAARHLCLDYLKDVRRLSIPFSMAPSVQDIPSEGVGIDDLKRMLGGALASLPPDLRDAFLLKHDSGYTYAEIAEIAGATPSAVKMRVHRARAMLRSYIGLEDPEDVTNEGASVVLFSREGLVPGEEV